MRDGDLVVCGPIISEISTCPDVCYGDLRLLTTGKYWNMLSSDEYASGVGGKKSVSGGTDPQPDAMVDMTEPIVSQISQLGWLSLLPRTQKDEEG